MKKYVLIGGSIACLGAIEGIQSVEKDADITVLCGEKTPLYSRPLISYRLEKKTTDDNLYFHGKDFYEKKGVKALFEKAVKIDPDEKTVTTESGKILPYDKLFVGTGSYPFVPPMNGLDEVKNKTCFYTLADEEKLASLLSEKTKLLIIGAGLIGLKCAEGAYAHTKDVTIVDLAPRVLPNATTPYVASLLEKKLKEMGVKVVLGASVAAFSDGKAELTDGKILSFDAVVLAIGVRPQIGLLKDAGAETNRGVVVDETMKTSLQDVYCAGDCAEGYDAVSGQKRLLQLFPSAYNGGRVAGRNMAGKEEVFKTDCALNSTSLFGLRFTSCGSYDGEPTEIQGEGFYKAFYVKDGRLIGYMLVGDTKKAGIYTRLISEKIPLSTVAGDLFTAPSLAIFDEKTRKKYLAKIV